MTERQIEHDIRGQLSDAATVLLLSPSFTEGQGDLCADLLVPRESTGQNALWVSYTKSPDEQVRRFRSHSAGAPRDVGVISVDDAARSATAAGGNAVGAGGAGTAGGAGATTETVTSPGDLTGLGIRITEYLQRWRDADGRTVVCFDSLTAMLQYVELETAYQFLHVLTGRFATVDAFAHFHMDPAAHDDQTVETIVSLFDAVVEIDDDGTTVRTR